MWVLAFASMIDLDETSRAVGSKILAYEHGRFQSPQFPTARMRRALELVRRTLTNGVPVKAVCTVSLGHRFRVSNGPVKTPVKLSPGNNGEWLENIIDN
jgi:hypothetical protein